MDLAERRELLVATVELLSEARATWADADAEVVTLAYEEALEDTFAAFRDGDMPAECRSLAKDVDALETHWRRYTERVLQSGNPRLLPDNGFNAAFDAMENRGRGLREPERKILESIAELTKQGVSDAQICEIYGWIDGRTGQPQLWKLAEERAQPGKHTSPESGFVPPTERLAREQGRQDQEQLERIRSRVRQKREEAAAPPPESLEDLVGGGVCLRQIAEMLHVDVDRAAEMIRAEGLRVPSLDYEPVQTARAPAEPKIAPETERAIEAERANPTRGRRAPRRPAAAPVASEKPKTLELSIVELHQAGKDPVEIARSVSTPELEIKPGKVAAVIARFQKDPEAFGGG